jgi:hypothetical protein
MNRSDQSVSSPLRRLARKVASIIAECSYADRRMAALRLSPDRYLMAPQRMPETLSEFLFRTSGLLPHEPSAAQRGTGRHPVS